MEVFIPVIPSTNYGGPWGRDPFGGCCSSGRGRCAYRNPALNRLRRGHQSCSPARSVMMPRAVRLVDEMDMDDWITPADLISAALLLGANAAAGAEEQNQATEAPTSPAKESQVSGADKNVFEVKLNVSDYKPEELIVKILNGVVTIEGKHEETKTHKGEEGKEDGPKEFVSTHFKRSFIIPKSVIEEKLECKLTEDGRLVVSAPLKAIEPAPEQPAIRSIPISVEAAATVTGTGTGTDNNVQSAIPDEESAKQADNSQVETGNN